MHGDCREVLADLGGFTAVVTDPPYGLGFMGKAWDHGVPGPEFWTAIKDACLPGAPLLAFGGDRTHHRLMVALEDAGWEIRTCLYWLFATGFPKSLNVEKAISSTLQKDADRSTRKGGGSQSSCSARSCRDGEPPLVGSVGDQDDVPLPVDAQA